MNIIEEIRLKQEEIQRMQIRLDYLWLLPIRGWDPEEYYKNLIKQREEEIKQLVIDLVELEKHNNTD